ncbi:hypothetical protein [Flavobacterium sp.]|uniref:hypothetical protein n=1 Tax=Flavobacterium sp. TaxID=239 RepID=UPI0039E52D3E
METRSNRGSEDQPLRHNPDEVRRIEPAKEIHAQDKIHIVQSGFGREQGQTPADEHIEERISQIDEQTRNIRVYFSEHLAEPDSSAGYMNDASSADRDTGNGDDHWDANSSRSARHK